MRLVDAELVGRILLGKLEVLRKLGSGGSGDVYEVVHRATKHHRALKVLRRELCESGEAVERLVREAAASSRVTGGFVAQAFDAGRIEDGRAYILMELVTGPTLASELASRGRLPEREARSIAHELARGLATVHAASMVHRDVKPSNVVRSDEGLRLLDFGLAKLLANGVAAEETLTREGALVGTPQYMAPEQFDAKARVGPAADVWAVGAVLFELLTGRPPYEGKTPAAIAAAIHRAPAPRVTELEPDVSDELARVVSQALEREPERRHASMAALAEDLRAGVGGMRVGEGELGSGETVDARYEILRVVGRGGSGVVYEALDREGGARVAVKVLASHVSNRAGATERVAREARLASEAASDRVVSVLASGRDDRIAAAYLVMPLCEGAALSERVRAGAVPIREAIEIARAVAEALDAIHARGIVHRDVKPGNILLDGANGARLADFGLAREVDAHESASPTGAVLGTPLYMAPEQARRDVEIGRPADVYALGHVAFTMLVGAAYFEEDARAGILPLLGAIGRGTSEPASVRARRAGVELAPAFDEVFARATHVEPAKRFASAGALVDALERSLGPAKRTQARAPWIAGAAFAAAASAMLFNLATTAPELTAEARSSPSHDDVERAALDAPSPMLASSASAVAPPRPRSTDAKPSDVSATQTSTAQPKSQATAATRAGSTVPDAATAAAVTSAAPLRKPDETLF